MDSSDSSEANQASSQPSVTEDNIGMEPKYYKAAAEGKIEVFQGITEPLNQLLTPNRNTVLHIHLANPIKRSEDSESSKTFVEEILTKCPLLLWQANVKGETPLHIAARYGYAPIVEVLIERANSQEELESGVSKTVKEMLEMPNNEKDTAFHEAVRGKHLDVVKRLIQEGLDISYSQNDAGETPLYIAVERDFKEVAFHILETCTSPAHDGPLGRTTLHAAVIWNNYYTAHQGHHLVMGYILEYCPDCCELVDERGWNALHFVVNSSSSRWLEYGAKYFLKTSSLNNLLNEKDVHGNTPLHHHSKSLQYIKDVMCHDRVDKMAFNKRNLDAYDIALTSEELSDKKFMQITRDFKGKHCRAEFRRPLEDDILPKRKDFSEPWKAEREAHKAEWKARKDRFVSVMEKASNSHLVADTLIATVAFTAGITMPGGFISQEGPHSGSPVLMRNTAFKAFIITNTIAMAQSCSAAFIHLFTPLLFQDKDPGDFSFLLASLAFCLTISAMGAMVLAFVMGTYAVLMQSLGLAIANSVIGLLFFIPVFFVSIGGLNYLLEILRVGSLWILDRLRDFRDSLLEILAQPLIVYILRIAVVARRWKWHN